MIPMRKPKPDSWAALKNALKEMPEIITRALALLFESDLSELHAFSSDSKSAMDFASDVSKQFGKKRKPARPDRNKDESAAAGVGGRRPLQDAVSVGTCGDTFR